MNNGPFTISDVTFRRIADTDSWVSDCGRIKFWLSVRHGGSPWRISVDGERCNSRYSTPFVAVTRAKKGLKTDVR